VITARVDTSSPDMFTRNRVRVVASATGSDNRTTIFARMANSGDYYYVVPDGEHETSLPEGISLYALDASTDVARAVYLALRDHFEPKDAVPVASDRAYSDARQDIERAHALINKLVDAVTNPPTTYLSELVSEPPESRG
jgi:hypothetical protein